jgi:hypothetical protein
MSKSKIYVIHSNSKIESLYTLFPLIISKYSHLIKFLYTDSKEVKVAEGACVILVRVFKGNKQFADEDQKKRNYIKELKNRFDRVIMLDDGAGSDSLHHEYMDLVDLYYKGKILKDTSNYLRPMYGRQIFTNYYNEKFGVIDDNVKLREIPNDSSVLKKLRVSWNLGYGIYPMPGANWIRLARGATGFSMSKALRPWYVYSYKKMIRQLNQPIDCQNKLKKVQARFSYNSLPNTIGYQRKILVQKCKTMESAITGKISSGAYNNEIRKVAAVLSPFGWGEVCLRDFEAIINGSLLIKPNMDHIETWPSIYQNSKTYLPIDWDGSDIEEIIEYVSNHIMEYRDIVETAKEVYKKSLLAIDHKILDFLEEATETKIE